jgi:myosin-crossreactive antigen
MTVTVKDAHLWMMGGGIASMTAAAFLIRDVGWPEPRIRLHDLAVHTRRDTQSPKRPSRPG